MKLNSDETTGYDIENYKQTICQLIKQISKHKRVIKTLEISISERDSQIKTLEISISERDSQIKTLEISISERDNQITSISEQLRMAKEALQKSIEDRDRSIIWQMTQKYHNGFVERALPQGTERRKWYEMALEHARTIINRKSLEKGRRKNG